MHTDSSSQIPRERILQNRPKSSPVQEKVQISKTQWTMAETTTNPTADPKQTQHTQKAATTAELGEYPSLVREPRSLTRANPATAEGANATIDLSISRSMDPVPKEVSQMVCQEANKFIRKQRVLESTMAKDTLRQRQEELNMRRNFDTRTIKALMLHPYYTRMMMVITEEMIEEEGLWRRYRPNKFIKDTETSRRRIQNAIPMHNMEYAIKYNKKPWRYPGKNKIKTKFYDKVDWVDDPYVVLEEKTEQDKKKESVVA